MTTPSQTEGKRKWSHENLNHEYIDRAGQRWALLGICYETSVTMLSLVDGRRAEFGISGLMANDFVPTGVEISAQEFNDANQMQERELAQLKARLEAAEKERDQWKQHHDNQVEVKRRLSEKYGELVRQNRVLVEEVRAWRHFDNIDEGDGDPVSIAAHDRACEAAQRTDSSSALHPPETKADQKGETK